MSEDTRLSSRVTVAQYRLLEASQDRDAIADFIHDRFAERYIAPLRGEPGKKHGFCTMAICCLMIEALESFWQGLPDTNRRSRQIFRAFFQRSVAANTGLRVFAPLADAFYDNVRCGILHQAETYGWRIVRRGRLFDDASLTVNATRFHDEMARMLDQYSEELRRSDWDSNTWQRLRAKMQAVIRNCA